MPSRGVPAGQLRGVVIDRYRGVPIPGMGVGITGRRWVVADSLGRFVIDSLPEGAVKLEWEGFMHGSRADTMHFVAEPQTGYYTTLTAGHRAPAILCVSEGSPSPKLAVRLRTHPTGAPPGRATVIARQHAEGDSTEVRLAPGDTVLWAHLFQRWSSPRDGLTVRVRSPGYHPWEANDLTFAESMCGGYSARGLEVWLQPQ